MQGISKPARKIFPHEHMVLASWMESLFGYGSLVGKYDPGLFGREHGFATGPLQTVCLCR